ncbi:hypothetical protein AMELA_G00160110 [Ameiurus melas]|uniref:Uncharacterized protein n=1 Tax=Ameiurus melas TaxID=219545 RepID=A0A7J6AEV5_AMEME|nr:hypothetical protein AMELA_G00160110 [Ameiurus melas]
MGNLEPIPGSIGHKAGYTLDRAPVICPTGQYPQECAFMLPWCGNSASSPDSLASPSLALSFPFTEITH